MNKSAGSHKRLIYVWTDLILVRADPFQSIQLWKVNYGLKKSFVYCFMVKLRKLCHLIF